MKIYKTKSKKDVSVLLVEEAEQGLVYELDCDGAKHRITVGFADSDPVGSLRKCSEAHAELMTKRERVIAALRSEGLEVRMQLGKDK